MHAVDCEIKEQVLQYWMTSEQFLQLIKSVSGNKSDEHYWHLVILESSKQVVHEEITESHC